MSGESLSLFSLLCEGGELSGLEGVANREKGKGVGPWSPTLSRSQDFQAKCTLCNALNDLTLQLLSFTGGNLGK